ncbi:MAG: thrombospondin type 3 repeat-containing protein [Actinomycetota bacterium]
MRSQAHRPLRAATMVIVAAMVLAASPVHAVTWVGQGKVYATEGVTGDRFGTAVAVDGTTAVVGAPDANDRAGDSGAAYVFVLQGGAWGVQSRLVAPDGEGNDAFGTSVAIDGDVAIVGTPEDNGPGNDSGSAYVFRRTGSTWAFEQRITAPDAGSDDRFGQSVSISGDAVAVGAPEDDFAFFGNTGSAYVFRRTGGVWTFEEKITAPVTGTSPGDEFGSSVAIDASTVVVGSPRKNVGPSDTGAAFVYTRPASSWTLQQQLTATDAAADDRLGASVALSGDTVLAGAPDRDDMGDNAGAAYVFRREGTTWAQAAKVLAPDGAASDNFGASVDVDGTYGIAGAFRDDGQGTIDSGSAWILNGSASWAPMKKLQAFDRAAGDNFGMSVSIAADLSIGGAPGDDDLGSNAGSAYFFALDTDEDGVPDNIDNCPTVSNPDQKDTDGDGQGDACDDDDDNDGISDEEEAEHPCMDPLVADADADPDGDGLSNADEINTHDTDPCDADSDDDGQRDGYEVSHGSDPNDPASIGTPLGPITLPTPLPIPAPEL